MIGRRPEGAGEERRGAGRDRALGRLRVLALLTLVATYSLVVLGSTVRVTESGMGCRGWPLCSGQIGAIDRFHALLEQSHRYLVVLVTLLVIGLAVLARRTGERARHVRRPSLLGVGTIAVQIVLGAITVVTDNAPVTVALHLAVGLCFLGVVTVTAVASFADPERPWSALVAAGRLGCAAVAGLFLVIVSGSLVVDGGAEGACASWPVCLGSRAAGGLVALQLVHRSVVLVGAGLVVVYLLSVLGEHGRGSLLRRLAVAALALLALQVGVGALDAVLRAPEALADLHLALAGALFATLVAVAAIADRRRTTPSRARQRLGWPSSRDARRERVLTRTG